MLHFLVTDFNNQNKLFVQGSKAFLSPNCHLICNSENKLDLHPCIKKGHQQNLDWIGSDQPLYSNLLNHNRLGDRVTGVSPIWANPGFAAVHKTATQHLSMWKAGKCQHLCTCIFMYFSPISFYCFWSSFSIY